MHTLPHIASQVGAPPQVAAGESVAPPESRFPAIGRGGNNDVRRWVSASAGGTWVVLRLVRTRLRQAREAPRIVLVSFWSREIDEDTLGL